MSAHLRAIHPRMCNRSGCHKQATEQLFTTRNEPVADYCGKHGREALTRALEDERRHVEAHA